jgi:hypothetical protein
MDVTVIRCFIVPALMSYSGDWTWWTPAPLKAILERFFPLEMKAEEVTDNIKGPELKPTEAVVAPSSKVDNPMYKDNDDDAWDAI